MAVRTAGQTWCTQVCGPMINGRHCRACWDSTLACTLHQHCYYRAGASAVLTRAPAGHWNRSILASRAGCHTHGVAVRQWRSGQGCARCVRRPDTTHGGYMQSRARSPGPTAGLHPVLWLWCTDERSAMKSRGRVGQPACSKRRCVLAPRYMQLRAQSAQSRPPTWASFSCGARMEGRR